MSGGPTWKRFIWITAALAVLPPLVMLCASSLGFFPWSKLNCWSNEVDLSTGRIRNTRHLLWRQISQSIEESPVSRALGTNVGPEVWVFDSWARPGGTSRGRLVARVSGAVSLLVAADPSGCDRLVVTRDAGRAVGVNPRPPSPPTGAPGAEGTD